MIGGDSKYRDPVDVAREQAEDILRDYRPRPLAADKAAELDRIVATAGPASVSA